MTRTLRTAVLLAGLSGLLLWIGALLDGGTGGPWLTVMLLVAVAMNLGSYWYSDRLALRMARAVPLDAARFGEVHAMVRALAARAGQPEPRLFRAPSPQLNAFATGRSPRHAAVCLNDGLLRTLDRDELEGVIAHELQHVYNRDILIGSVAATIATAISYLALILRFVPLLGGSDQRGTNPAAAFAAALLAPIIALLLQASITRSREAHADHTGAELTGKPLALARALVKLEAAGRDPRLQRAGGTPAEVNAGMQHLYIAAPFGGRAASRLFATHPPIPERIAALEQQARRMGQLPPRARDPHAGGGWHRSQA